MSEYVATPAEAQLLRDLLAQSLAKSPDPITLEGDVTASLEGVGVVFPSGS